MTAEKRPRDTRYVFRWHVVTYQMKNSLYSLSAFCAQSAVYILYLVCILYPVCSLAVCILHWPIGKACDNTDSIFCPVAILCTYWTLGHSRWKPTFTIVTLPHISVPFPFPLSAMLNSLAGYRCTLVPRLPFTVPGTPLPVLVTSCFALPFMCVERGSTVFLSKDKSIWQQVLVSS